MKTCARFRSVSLKSFAIHVLTVLVVFCAVYPVRMFAETAAEQESILAQKIGSKRVVSSGLTRTSRKTTNDSVTGTYSGGETEDDETFAVSASGATVSLSWDMYDVPDRLEVVGSLVLPGISLPSVEYLNTGSVQHQGGQTLYIPPGSGAFQVIMNRGGGLSGTAWTYTITITDGDATGISGVDGNPNQIKYDPFDPLKDLVVDPIDPSTGAHNIRKTLLSLGGARPLTFEINYNSLLGFNGPLGTGWSHNHQAKLQGLSNGQVLLSWNNKRQNAFHPSSTDANTLVSNDQAALFYTLSHLSDGSFFLRAKDQSYWLFDSTGRMEAQGNPVNQVIVYDYAGAGTVPIKITESVSGRSFLLTYDSQNKITQVSDNTGRTVSFAYSSDQTDRLVGITLAEGSVSQTYTYTYDNNGRVLNGTTPEGIKVFQDAYDAEQRVVSQQDALGNATYFSYDEASQPGNIVTTVTDRLGKKSVYVSNAAYHLVQHIDPLGDTTTYTYNQNGSRASATDPNGHKTQFGYDANENPISTTDATGGVLNSGYDAQNRLVSVTNAAGQHQTITYDTSNRPIATTDFQGNQTTFSYSGRSLLASETLPRGGKRQFINTAGQPTQITDPDGNISKVEYDTKGRPSALIDAAGNRSTLAYDIKDHLISRTDPLGNTTRDTYDSRGLRLSHTDPSGATTTFVYDGNGNLFYRQDALNGYTVYGYDAEGRPYGVSDADKNTTYFFYDDAGRLTTISDPLKNNTFLYYDAAGNRTAVIDALGNQVSTTTFDGRNLPVLVRDALNRQTTNKYDASGRLSAITDPLNRTKTYAYDANNRLTSSANPLNQVTAQSFDADGSLASLTDAKKKGTALEYDLADRLTSITTPTGEKTSYVYDARGLLIKTTKPSGEVSTITYDAAGRKSTLTDGTGVTKYTYDADGRLLTTTRDYSPITRVYDALGRVTKITDNVGYDIGYNYDAVGNLTSLAYANGHVINYSYDAANRLTSVTDATKHVTSYAYDADGRLLTTTRADGSVESRTYDAAGKLTQIADTANGKNIYKSVRTFDAAGQVISEVTKPKAKAPPPEQTVMTFDADNRLATFDGIPTSFDANSNMTQGPVPGASSSTLYYDTRNHLIGAGVGSNYTGYYYDAENFRTAVGDGNGGGYTDVYDRSVPLNRLLERVNPDGSVTSYIYGLGLISEETDDSNGNNIAGSYKVYHFDARGSTVGITDMTGNIVGRAKYGPFGELIKRNGTAANTSFLFNGQYGVMTDANGLDYMRARYYDPVIRRFINHDPTLSTPEDGSGLNRFMFANGNPVSLIDPFGLSADEDFDPGLLYKLGVGLIGFDTAGILINYDDLIASEASRNGLDPDLIRAVILNESITRIGGGYTEALLSYGHSLLYGDVPTYGPAQLGGVARADAGLTIYEALTYGGAIRGASNFLAEQRNTLIQEGITNPTDAQIATRYNQGSARPGQVTLYGQRVQYLIDLLYH